VLALSFFAQHGYGKSDKLDVLADRGVLGGVILSAADESVDALRGTTRAMAREASIRSWTRRHTSTPSQMPLVDATRTSAWPSEPFTGAQ